MANKAIPFKIKPFVQGEYVADATDIELQTGRNLQTSLLNVESINLGWNFAANILDTTNPGGGNMALNNNDKDLATIATFSTTSGIDNARFDELLEDIAIGDRIFLQERDATNTSILFRVTGNPTLTGTKVDIPITAERNQGPSNATFADSSFVAVSFFFTRTVTASGLPQNQSDWLGETSSQQLSTTTVTNIAPTVADVLIWRRSAVVTQSGIGDSGTGLLISEANRQSDGTFDRASGTSVYNDDLANAYIYIGITASDFANLTLNATFLEARRDGGLVFSASLESLIDAESVDGISTGQFSYRRTTNNQYHYVTGDILTVVTRSTTSTTQYIYGTPAGDFTQNISDLPFSAVDQDFTGRVNGPANHQELTADDTVKLTGLLVSTATSSGEITVSYKDGPPTANIADYDKTWNASNPVLATFGSQRIVSILVNNNVTISSISGGATVGPQLLWIPRHYIYQVTLPAEVSTGTPTSHLPSGVTETFLPTGFNDNYKIVRANVEANLLAAIDSHGNSADLATLQSKINALFPLTADVDILRNWANIYDPIHGAATVDILNGYSLIADYRSSAVRYESAGLTFGTGTNVITYTGLTQDLHRSFAFALPQENFVNLLGSSGTANIVINGVNYLATFNTDLLTTEADFVTTHAAALNTEGISVTAQSGVIMFLANDPSETFTISVVNVTGNLAGNVVTPNVSNKTLMWIVNGSENIPFVDITSGGNIRVNNYTPSQIVGQRVNNEQHFLTRSAGSEIVTTADGSLATFIIPNFPSGVTEQIRTLQVGITVYEGTTNTLAGHLEEVGVPAINASESLQTFDASIFLGPSHGGQTVNVTIGYTFRVDGANLVVDLTLESAPSGFRVSFDQNTEVTLSYTAQSVQARVDSFQSLSDGGGTFTFTGQQEFILSARPSGNGLDIVPVSVGSDGIIDQLNDTTIRLRIPDSWDEIQVADDIGFKTWESDHYFTHSELAGLLALRTQRWAYGIARLQTINAGHSITEAVDLATGSTIGGNPIGPGTLKAELVVYEALNKTTGANGLVESVVLPTDYATYNYMHVTEYDATNLQFRHAEFPTHILDAGLVDTNDNIRLQGNSFLRWTAGTRTIDFNPTAQEILRVSLKD